MKRLFTNSLRGMTNQKGQALVLISLSAAALMAFTGLGIDAANMYLKKSKLQAAVDAGTIAGITKLVARVSASPDLTNQSISIETAENIAKQVVAFNLQQMGIAEGSLDAIEGQVTATGTIDPNSRAITLDVSATITIETLLLGVLTELSSSVDATATGTGRRNPAIISLVLDRSGSMSGELNDLKEAAKNFIDSFVTHVDQMALITFNGVATVEVPMSVMTETVKTILKNEVDNMNAGGWTGIAEGIELGRVAIESTVNIDPAAARNAVEAIVLMTDGAPTTIRGDWQNHATGIGQPLTPNGPGGARIYYALPFFDDGRIHDENENEEDCSQDGNIAECLNDFSYLDSKGNLQGFDDNGDVITNMIPQNNPMDMRKEMYDLAIIESGYAKDFRNAQDQTDSGISLFVVGLGEENSADADDPYEDVGDNQSLKPVLLRAIANVPDAAFDPVYPYLASNFDENRPEGLYLETPDSNELTELFLKIARRIQLRLVD